MCGMDGTKQNRYRNLKLLYHEIPQHYVWSQEGRKWIERQKCTCLGRVHHVSIAFGEMLYLRVLINKVRGPKHWDDFKEFENIKYATYKEACQAPGLLNI